MDLETAVLRPDSPLRVSCRTQIRLWGFQFHWGMCYSSQMARWRSRANVIWDGCRQKYRELFGKEMPKKLRDRNRIKLGEETMVTWSREVRELINETNPDVCYALDCHATIIGHADSREYIHKTYDTSTCASRNVIRRSSPNSPITLRWNVV